MNERCATCKEKLLWSDTKQRFIHYGAWHDKKKYDHNVVRDIGYDAPINTHSRGWVWRFPDGKLSDNFVAHPSKYLGHDGLPSFRPHSSGAWVLVRVMEEF